MCQKCVNEGLLTQDQHDRLIAGEPVEAVLTPEEVARYADSAQEVGIGGRVMAFDMDSAPEFLKNLFEKGGDTQSPDEKAQEDMDRSVADILEMVKSRQEILAKAARADGTEVTPRVLDMMAQSVAGEVMFRINATSIAYRLVLVAMRYADVLDQWATLYVAAARDIEDLEVDLDSATTPESRDAVTKAAEEMPDRAAGTGMYL